MKEVIDEDIDKAMTQFELMNGVRAESKAEVSIERGHRQRPQARGSGV